MIRLDHITGPLGYVWLSALWTLMAGYFVYHAFAGENSIATLRSLDTREAELLAMFEAASHDRHRLEGLVRSLDRNHTDPDLLEELARKKLGLVHQDERIILLD